MNEHIDLSQFDVWPDGRPDTKRKHGEILRETTKRKLHHLANDAEQVIDYVRQMIRDGHDVEDELKEAEVLANSLMLVVMLLKREASHG